MRLKDWLTAEVGRAARLSEHLGFKNGSMVSQMANGIVDVPVKHYRAIRDFTGGEVTLDDLLPVEAHSEKTA